MRFGHFFYPMNFDPSRDYEAIEECLLEAELVEQLGFDAIWIAEHHFIGEAVYGDPLMFAAAVAVKTHRVTLGLGIIEMALHNPVQLAISTALLDNLSRGRLIVGTGRGSNYNAFEYTGFGTTVEEGRKRLLEAEDLLVKAWTTENLEYQGEYWQVSFPAVRPRPYQKPHPPLARACLSDDSIISMGKIARPVLFRGRSIEAAGRSIRLYRETMQSSGFDETTVENALDNSWFWYEAHLAETDDDALDGFLPIYESAGRHVAEMRKRWNPKDQEVSTTTPPLSRSAYKPAPNTEANENLIGSPSRVAEQVHLLSEAGVRNLMLTNRGLMSPEDTAASLRLLSEQVMPQFRST
ncbi:MAG: LLM class flavin-dependent oxidoreductase [Chloroflexi bacterium]|nr:LLM class flavin-dependent oxidoreductase [Chloroflexota bacterium]